MSGFELIADELDLAAAVEEADLVVTGEGFVDEASFQGKVVGGIAALAAEYHVPVLVVAGEQAQHLDGTGRAGHHHVGHLGQLRRQFGTGHHHTHGVHPASA